MFLENIYFHCNFIEKHIILYLIMFSIIVGKLHYIDIILYRVVNSIFQPLIISLIYCLIVHWLFHITSGRQFIRYWMFNWLTIIVLSVMIAFFLINCGIFANICLVAIVVTMISAATIQIALELSPKFFRYGYATPLYQAINGGRHLLFQSHSRFGINVGILIIYFIVLIIPTILTAIMWSKKRQHDIQQEIKKKNNIIYTSKMHFVSSTNRQRIKKPLGLYDTSLRYKLHHPTAFYR